MQPRPTTIRLRARVLVAALGVTLGCGAAIVVPPAHAETPRPTSAPAAPATVLAPPSPELPGLPTTSLELAGVPVTSPAFDQAATDYGAVDARHSEVRAGRHDLDHTTTVLEGRVQELNTVRASASARVAGLSSRLDAINAAIQELAVRAFVTGDDDERTYEALVSETPAVSDLEQRDVLGGLTMEVLLAERAAYRGRIDEARARAKTAADDGAEARAALAELREDRPAAVRDEVDAAGEVAAERVTYEEARVLATVEGVEFPLVALDAYYRAATSVAEEKPACGVRWWGIAGISRVEGRHGTYGGTTLQSNGDTTRRIIGIQLNGSRETAVVGDSDGGALDGDASFDRAVGPMQFIPQTWSRFQADGNDDGTTSPFNLYDATLAAANYLCTASTGLDADKGLRTAYFSYNHSLAYVEAVLGYARQYEDKIDVPEPTE